MRSPSRSKIIWIVLISWCMNGISYAESSAPAIQEGPTAVLIRAGTSANVDLICYDKENHSQILGIIAEGNTCLKNLTVTHESLTPSWYSNPWILLGLGLAAGGVTGYFIGR